jgi:hypothetical protein
VASAPARFCRTALISIFEGILIPADRIHP